MQNIYSLQFMEALKKAFFAITPWKMNYGESEEYRKGWNACVKDIKKNRVRCLNELWEVLD